MNVDKSEWLKWPQAQEMLSGRQSSEYEQVPCMSGCHWCATGAGHVTVGKKGQAHYNFMKPMPWYARFVKA